MLSRRGFSMVEVLVVIAIIVVLIAILLPALRAARQTAVRTQSGIRLRTIHQAMVLFAQGNNGWLPGFDGQRFIDSAEIPSVSPPTPPVPPLHGSTVQARFALLVDRHYLQTPYLLSPIDAAGAVWIPNGDEALGPGYYSYAMLMINDDPGRDPVGSDGRRQDWRLTMNSEAPVLSDRLQAGSVLNDPDTWFSIHTDRPGDWRGHVLWHDNHLTFESSPVLARTRYGETINHRDNLFYRLPGLQDGPTDADANAMMAVRGADQPLP